jgi:sterol desaturase/sphingolipid hydroxylase (fatty acid hydroxylase superfamily)
LHPFLLFWNGFHILISPFASHSGWEDHFSADLHHYLHHRYYECNYGAGIPFDKWFGTYRDKLKPQHSTEMMSTPIADPKASLWNRENGQLGIGPPENLNYIVACIATIVVILLSTLPSEQTGWSSSGWLNPHWAALLLSTCPCWLAYLFFTTSSTQSPWSPFEKDYVPKKVVHIGLGFLFGVFPTTYLLYLILSST